MTNRLADLERNVTQHSRVRQQPGQRNKTGSGLKRMRQPDLPASRIRVPSVARQSSLAVDDGQSLSARVSRWPAGHDRRVRSYSAVSYDIPGIFNVLAQPTGNSCWATAFTMLKSWRVQQSMTIEQALATVGREWVEKFKRDDGLSADDKPMFLASAGLVAEPPQNFSVAGWEQLLRQYGPLWVTTDEAPGRRWGIHARIILGIQGDGTPENTRFKIVDPAGGRRYEEPIAIFIPKFEEEIRSTGYARIQVVHWQTDGRSEQQSLGRRTTAVGQAKETMHSQRANSLGLSLDRVMEAQRQSRYTIDTRYNVQLVPQQTGMSCWAAGFAMIVGWRDQISIDPAEIARASGHWAQYKNGLQAEDISVMNVWGFVAEAPATYTVQGFADLLSNYGPLWVASAEQPGPHIRVVTGIQGDGSADGTLLYINDPWERGMSSFQSSNRGSQYTESYSEFLRKQSELAERETGLEAPIYIAHLPRLPDWMLAPEAKSLAYYMNRPIALEAPSNPGNYRRLTSGSWSGNTSLSIQGGQGMWFKIHNTNVLGATINISDQFGQNKSSVILPLGSVEFLFTVFGNEPMYWRFDISTNSDAFLVTWELWSTWVPGMPPNR